MLWVVADEVAGPWPDYLRQNVSTACIFDCPCEAVSLSNVLDCLKLKIPHSGPYPDPTKEPFSTWDGRESLRPGDSPYVRAPARTSLASTRALGKRQGSAGRRARPTVAPYSAAPPRALRQKISARSSPAAGRRRSR